MMLLQTFLILFFLLLGWLLEAESGTRCPCANKGEFLRCCEKGYEFMRNSSVADEVAGMFAEDERNLATNLDESTKQYRMDVVVGFGAEKVRSFWEPFIHFWPLVDGNKMILITESDTWELNSTKKFAACLKSSDYVPEMVSSPYIANDKPYWFRQNAWKFFLDQSSEADVLVIIDDDSCLLDHIRISDILVKDKIKVHGLEHPAGIRIPRGHQYFVNFMPKAMGVKDVAHFMTDFPISIWRGMLHDFRKWLIRHVLNEDLDEDMGKQYEQVAEALDKMAKHGGLSEFNLLLHFAYYDENWKHRYDWQLAPSRLSFGLSTHEHAPGCPPVWKNRSLQIDGKTQHTKPIDYLYYPFNLHIRNDDKREGFKSVDWKTFLVKPFMDARLNNQTATYDQKKETNCENGEATLKCWERMFAAREASPRPVTLEKHFPHLVQQWSACFAYVAGG